jgi:hypothetical protein
MADDAIEPGRNSTNGNTLKQAGTRKKSDSLFQRIVGFFDNWNKIFGAIVGFLALATVLWAGVAHLVHSSPTHSAGASSTGTARYVVTPESCAVFYDVEGAPSPELCPDGHPSRVVDHWFRERHFKVFSLGPNASPNDVIAAICSDLASNPTVRALPYESFAIEGAAVKLWEAEEKWQSALVPAGDIASFKGSC